MRCRLCQPMVEPGGLRLQAVMQIYTDPHSSQLFLLFMSDPKGYLYAELDVTDQAYFDAEYVPRVKPVLEKYGARFLVAGGNPDVREGDRVVRRVVFLEFENAQRARAFYDSPDYQDVIGHRFASAKAHLYLLDGAAP